MIKTRNIVLKIYAISSRIYKIALFYLLSFVLIYCTTASHSLSLIVICYHSLPSAATCHVSLSFVVTQFITRCHSLWLVVTLVVIRCATRCRSLSLIVIRCTTRCHSLSLVVNRCTTHLPFYKRSLNSYVEEYLFLQNTFWNGCFCSFIKFQHKNLIHTFLYYWNFWMQLLNLAKQTGE